MNRIVIVMIAALAACPAFSDTWTDPDTGFTWSYSISGNEATITGISPTSGEMPPIPSELGGKPVISIGTRAFLGCSGLTGSLTLPNCVMNIGDSAFSGCSGLTGSLTIPNAVTNISRAAFRDCSGFSGELIISEGVKTIGGGFDGRGYITWPNGDYTLSDLAAGAFSGCSGFTGSLTIPGSVVEIGKCAFEKCTGFDGALIIEQGVTNIADRAFSCCNGFTGLLTIPENVKTIGNMAFIGCKELTGLLTIPEGLTSIGASAFSDCTGFTAVALPSTVESLDYAFNRDVGINDVTIADGAKVVSGFSGCTGLTSVEIPNSVTNIGKAAFSGCTQLVNLNLPTNLKVIGESAFSGCRKLLKLEWPVGVTVGSSAFSYCTSWQGVLNVPDGVTEIANGVFSGCSGLQQINLPDSITRIGSSAFSGCSSLKEMSIPQGVDAVSVYMFAGCASLVRVTIPDSVRSIGDHSFVGCEALTELKIPHGVTSIGSYVFVDNVYTRSGVKLITLPNTLVSVSRTAFVWDNISTVVFEGELPSGYELWDNTSRWNVSFGRNSGGYGLVTWPVKQFMGYTQTNAPTVTIVSSKIRENDPEVMDVVYRVNSTKPTVKVRALAFEDGERSFAKVVRAENFVADLDGNETSGNVGDAITANEEHTLSWKVSADWATRLAKVSFEVLATEDDILPLELMTIPGTAAHPETWQVSWNYVTSDKSFEALLWLYADRDLGLTLEDGVLKNGSTRLCSGSTVSAYDALVYIYGKMGFQLLDGDSLDYVKEATRLELPDKSQRQYAYRVVTGD